MTNPVLVEVSRGGEPESRHRGAVAVFDAQGKSVLSIGDIDAPVYPRSAIKAMQALPLVESGAADKYGFGNRELALACASHGGEPGHVELVKEMLAKAGRSEHDLECGVHWPADQKVLTALAASRQTPGPAHNNCSGKHTGFICTMCHEGVDPAGYVGPGHKAQKNVRAVMAEVTGIAHSADHCGTDGCSIPTYAVPLKYLAQGFAKMASGKGLGSERAKAAKRLLAACIAEPWLMAGTGFADTKLIEAGKGKVFVKGGAEGVHCGAIPSLGLGIAIKCDDGNARASDVIIAAVLAKLMAKDEALAEVYRGAAKKVLKNWNGMVVGKVKAVGELG